MLAPRKYLALITEAFSQWWNEDRPFEQAAALAYYTIFSLAPLLVIATSIAGFVFGRKAAQDQVVRTLADFVGKDGGVAVQTIIENASKQQTSESIFAMLIGVAFLLFGAGGVVGQLQSSLNLIWGVETKPDRGWLGFLRDRFISYGMVLGVGFLLLVSLIVTAAAPPMRTASAPSPTRSTPSRSSTTPAIVSARTRFPWSARAAARAVVCSSSSSSATPRRRSSSASAARERVVELVTKRSRWPASRSSRTASAAPGIGAPDTCSTPSTSRRMAAMERESIRVTRSVVLPLSEVELRFSRSSGPGGQHAQTSETRVEARFDVEASSALSEAQKRRVVAKAGPLLRAVAQDERSQLRNRELAVERLVGVLREALRVERRRVATVPGPAARERRLEAKRRRSATKSLRRPPAE